MRQPKITNKNDAYGHLLLDFFRTGQGLEVVERDDGLISVSRNGNKRYFSSHRQWPKDEQRAIQYAKGRVLDIGCGAGRHSLYLQHKGLRVVGIDNSPLTVRVCKLRGLKNALVMPIDRLKFKPRSFDTALMMFNNFGLFGTPSRAKRLLRRLHQIIRPGGMIIASSLDPYQSGDPVHIAYQKENRRRGRWPGQLRLRVRYGHYTGPWFDYLIVSRPEMEKILRGTGWRVTKYLQGQGGTYHAIIVKTT